MAQKIKDEDLAKLYLMGKSQKEIAKELHTTTATVCNRLKTPEFKRVLRSYRQEIVDEILNGLTTSSKDALKVLKELLEDESPKIRYNASSKILSLMQDFTLKGNFKQQRTLTDYNF